MKFSIEFRSFCLVFLTGLLIFSLSGCNSSNENAPLSPDNINLIFVVSQDLDKNAPGDINPDTANLTSQGLHRSLLMATYLKEDVLGGENVNGIYALTPMTHLQTENNYPDMTSIGSIQQFALLNQSTFSEITANSFPIKVAYAEGSVPDGVSVPVVGAFWPESPAYGTTCTGLDFNNTYGNNDALLSGIINNNETGYHVFSAPWETISDLMAAINLQQGSNMDLPVSYMGPNYVYAISIEPTGDTSLITYNSKLNPSSTYPELPLPVETAECTHSEQPYFSTVRTGGVDDVEIPENTNINQIIYIVRHAEAHPDPEFKFENGNYVAAGQWRALNLSNALRGKINPNMVYSIDPAQWFPVSKTVNVSYVRPSLTVLPYAIDNNLPYYLVSSFQLGIHPLDETVAQATSDFFFTGGTFSNQTILLAWESGHIRPLLNALLESYKGNPTLLPTDGPPKGEWPSTDYDTIWTVTIDENGNLTVDNALCEGIASEKLPVEAPQF